MKRFITKFLMTFVVAVLLTFTATDAYSQCAMCRATVESNVGTGSKEPESEVGAGLNTGILYLMIIPYLLVGTFGFLWYKYGRNKA